MKISLQHKDVVQMKIKRSVGPLDQRKRLTRCQPCAKRRIKCQGGSPCEYCVRTRKSCLPQTISAIEAHFVSSVFSEQTVQVAELPMQIGTHSDASYLDYFDLFMNRCQFTEGFKNLTADLLPLIQTCPPLREATVAIGALEASRRATVHSSCGRQSPLNVALGSYGKSIQSLQDRLQSSDALRCEGVLWCTLLLGLFELLTKAYGDQWAKHMLYGTARIIQSAGMTTQFGQLGKRLFGAFRLLEANRAILYGEGTFLSHETWLKYQRSLAANPASPMETLFDLLIQTSSFGKRFFDQIESIQEILRPNHPTIHKLAEGGCRLQARLQSWHDQTTPHADHSDPYYKLALANYHALQLYLCRNYTFYVCWEDQDIPLLTSDDIETHTTAVVALSNEILEDSNIPGLLLLFPLRMAGANTTKPSIRDKILKSLNHISQNGFIVSERIRVDLRELWEYQRLGVI